MAGGVACIANVSCQASQHVSSFIQQREMLFQQALFDCIMDTRVPGPKLRSNIAEEVKGRLEHVLAAHEKEPMHIIPSIRSRARFYHSSIHLRYRYGMSGEKLNNLLDKPVPRAGLYSHKDRNRVLYFWAVHQGNLNYGEISYELSLPLGCLLYWVMHFVNSIK
ncbi:hypothetical protein COCC4DRAFT_204913 [Bipolaris maydis ATCC 48331]|nr:uncharacterized protein COCC4DRAFT_204913 [Bipolaris maydis ATCC 48331]ENI01105.1 hypothetical protein COCC4DRAFT_204913 [Bipolaris maydis ATCC 48331]